MNDTQTDDIQDVEDNDDDDDIFNDLSNYAQPVDDLSNDSKWSA
jgi:hypothetical protein